MMKRCCLVFLLFLIAFQNLSAKGLPFTHGRLRVDEGARYLEYEDGTPFLYLGDTAWELLARLTKEEVSLYMENRKAKGFTVVQTVILPELDSPKGKLAIGVSPLVDKDSVRLNPAYLEHIDWVLQEAMRHGLFVGLLPTWGDKVDKQWGRGPELFDEVKARWYGRMLGERYADTPNIIWIVGGDRGGGDRNKAIWNAMAEGIKEKDKNHLMTYHPQGEHSSSFWFHDETWLDFNMFQSGHCQTSYSIYKRLLEADRNRLPTKPVMDGEPRYEDITVNFKKEDGRFIAYDVRKTLYQSMLSGACGYTYGCNNVWQMYAPGREPKCDARFWWYDSLDMEGCCQLKHFYLLWNKVDFRQGVPLKGILASSDGYVNDEAVAFGGDSCIICYFPGGNKWRVELGDEWVNGYTLQWMNPRNGELSPVVNGRGATLLVELPVPGNESDWVLVIAGCRNGEKPTVTSR